MKCPSCGSRIPWEVVSGLEFHCPTCGQGARIKRGYLAALYAIAVGMVVLISYGVGAGDRLWLILSLSVGPLYFIILMITVRLFPADTEPTGDFRGILYPHQVRRPAPPHDAPNDSIEGEEHEPETSPTAISGDLIHVVDHRTFEGLLVRAFLVVCFLGVAWVVAEPYLARVFPEYSLTQSGAREFPVAAQVEDYGMVFRNTSTESLTCTVVLGDGRRFDRMPESRPNSFAHGLKLAPGGEAVLTYIDLTRPGATDPLAVKAAAEAAINMTCRGQSGQAYSATLE